MAINKNPLITEFLKAKKEGRGSDIMEFFRWFTRAYSASDLIKVLSLDGYEIEVEKHIDKIDADM